MKINYSWLKEYIDIKRPLDEAVRLLTMSGSEVKAIDKAGPDTILDIEITPNRSDCLSYIGIARELAAISGKKIKMPPLKVKKRKPGKASFTVEIKDKDLCPRYTARLIRGVKVGESPSWLKDKIISMGLRPVNNVVDITNYVLFELGQPMHAFDFDKIKGGAVIIRRARSGEKMTAIDKIERPLAKDMLVIADDERPIAIGGVMGGLDTEVDAETKNILLESAYFDPVSVRRTSYKLALMSESSYRFERGVDPGMVLPASDRAALLIAEICGGGVCELVDKGAGPGRRRTISLRPERLNRILNLKLKDGEIKKVLSGLSLDCAAAAKGVIKASVPSFREDLKDEIDLVEEVARIYGYERIALTIPRIVSNPERRSLSRKAIDRAGEVLASIGLREVLTYGLLGRDILNKVSADFSETISVKNPISAEQELMRPSLVPGLLNVLNYNINRGIKDVRIFEIGAVYRKGPDGRYREKTDLALCMTGLSSSDWQREKKNVTFFDLKGVIEALFHSLGLDPDKIRFSPPEIYYGGDVIGSMPGTGSSENNAFDLKEEVFLAELGFDALLPHVDLAKRFSEIPRFPSVKRDISLVASAGVTFREIDSIVKEVGGGLAEKIELLGQYTGRQIPEGSCGLAIRIEYRSKDRTLTADEVDKTHSAVRKSLTGKSSITLR